MPSIEDNLAAWDQKYDWGKRGDEWSTSWGGAAAQWWGTIYPRIYQFAPAKTILEIAPGFGRWTQYLATICQRLVVVDLSPKCIEQCKERFARLRHIEYHVNDGRSLPMIEDGSIDFCFSFDSLVHCNADILGDYLKSLATKLAPDGIAFIHHSNVAGCIRRWQWLRQVRPRRFTHPIYYAIERRVNAAHWRATDVSAELVRELCAKSGLRCISQEIINWGGRYLNDCLSTIVLDGSRWSRLPKVIVNRHFMDEAERLRQLVCVTAPAVS
jgi:SAM-dependent methyltransferase